MMLIYFTHVLTSTYGNDVRLHLFPRPLLLPLIIPLLSFCSAYKCFIIHILLSYMPLPSVSLSVNTTPVAVTCIDDAGLDDLCESYVSFGLCSSDPWVRQFCKRSCDLCADIPSSSVITSSAESKLTCLFLFGH